MVLCAGLGTRLRPLTERWPKPAVPLLGQPLLRYTLATLHRAGVTGFAVNTHHLPDVMEATARAEAARVGLGVSVSHEPVIQGTAGGIRGAKAFLTGDPFVVCNGDILFALDLAAVVAEHRASGAAATLVLMAMPQGESYAAVEMDPRGQVVRIAGHGPGAAVMQPWHFTGVHVLSPAVFDFMSAAGEEDINRTVYPKMIARGLTVRGVVVQASWSDLGTPSRYLAAQQTLLDGRVPQEAFPNAWPFEGLVRVTDGAFRDAMASVAAGARVEAGAYVGPGCVVVAGGRVARAALLSGVSVGAKDSLTDCIAWDERRLAANGIDLS
jgi:mannose-1-phosphate guanylyltransferase